MLTGPLGESRYWGAHSGSACEGLRPQDRIGPQGALSTGLSCGARTASATFKSFLFNYSAKILLKGGSGKAAWSGAAHL